MADAPAAAVKLRIAGFAGEGVKVMGVVTIELITKDGAPRVALEWEANPVADTIADHVVAVVADIESNPGAPDALDQTTDDEHEEAVLRVVLEMLKEQFGSVEIDDAKEMITIKVDGEVAQVNHETKEIICESAQLKENITCAPSCRGCHETTSLTPRATGIRSGESNTRYTQCQTSSRATSTRLRTAPPS